jgi:hypothetical protein
VVVVGDVGVVVGVVVGPVVVVVVDVGAVVVVVEVAGGTVTVVAGLAVLAAKATKSPETTPEPMKMVWVR